MDDFGFLLDKVFKRSSLALIYSYWKKFITQMIVSLFPNFLHYYLNHNSTGDDSPSLSRIYLNSVSVFLDYLKIQLKTDIDTILMNYISKNEISKNIGTFKEANSKINVADVSKLYSDFLRQYYISLHKKLCSWLEGNFLEQYKICLYDIFSVDFSYYSALADRQLSLSAGMAVESEKLSTLFSHDVTLFLKEKLDLLKVLFNYLHFRTLHLFNLIYLDWLD